MGSKSRSRLHGASASLPRFPGRELPIRIPHAAIVIPDISTCPSEITSDDTCKALPWIMAAAELGMLQLEQIRSARSSDALMAQLLAGIDKTDVAIDVHYGLVTEAHEAENLSHIDRSKPVYSIVVETGGPEWVTIGKQVTELEIACSGLGSSIVGALSWAGSAAFRIATPAMCWAFTSLNDWYGWEDETEAVSEWKAHDEKEVEKWPGITSAMLAQSYPTWAMKPNFRDDLQPPDSFRELYAAIVDLHQIATHPADFNHVGGIPDIAPTALSHVLRWSENDLTERILNEAHDMASNNGDEFFNWIHMSNSPADCLLKYKQTLETQMKISKIIGMLI